MLNISNVRGFAEFPDHLKDSCKQFIQSILSSQFPDENVEIARVRPYADGVEVTFCKDNEEYTFSSVTPKFFEEV